VREKLKIVVGSDNVFRDLGFAESEAQNLLLRADLMIAIQRFSLDALVPLAARAGLSVRMTVKKAA